MPLADARTARVLITVLLFALGLGFLYVARADADGVSVCHFFCLPDEPVVSHWRNFCTGGPAPSR